MYNLTIKEVKSKELFLTGQIFLLYYYILIKCYIINNYIINKTFPRNSPSVSLNVMDKQKREELKLTNKLDSRNNCIENILICCKYIIVCETYGCNVLFFVELCKYILFVFSLQ